MRRRLEGYEPALVPVPNSDRKETLMSQRIAVLSALAWALVATSPLAAFASDEVNVSRGATLPGPGLAVHGFDVVAYFTEGRPTPGSAEHSVAHGGATYRFASAENLAAFEADPERYVPAYGGFCAYGVSVGKKFDGDPRLWRIEAGRLYLNLNPKIQKTWLEDVDGNIEKADRQWGRIAAIRVADL
jgi:YHS domain-containing protein